MTGKAFGLTSREKAILQLARQGFKTLEIATELELTESVVKQDRKSIHKKLGVNTIAGAVGKTSQPDNTEEERVLLRQALTPRQREVALLLVEGKTDKEIGTLLGIGERTAKKHVDDMRKKFSSRNRPHLASMLATPNLTK